MGANLVLIVTRKVDVLIMKKGPVGPHLNLV